MYSTIESRYLSPCRSCGVPVGERVAKYFIILAAVVLAAPVITLDVGTDPGGRIATAWLGGDSILDLAYNHSVELTRVEETYRIDPSGITLESMKWQSTGAGLPDSYDRWENGYYTSERRVHVGKRLSCWLLPVSEPEVRLDGRLLLRGYEEPALLQVRVRILPLGIHLVRLVAG